MKIMKMINFKTNFITFFTIDEYHVNVYWAYSILDV